MKDTLKKVIAGVGVAGAIAGGSVVVDNQTVTDAEIRSSIEQAVEQGKIPEIDLSKVSLERLAKGYLDVAMENGAVLVEENPTKDVYELIREKKQEKGEKLLPKSKETLEVK